jgi:hypothetical protein
LADDIFPALRPVHFGELHDYSPVVPRLFRGRFDRRRLGRASSPNVGESRNARLYYTPGKPENRLFEACFRVVSTQN